MLSERFVVISYCFLHIFLNLQEAVGTDNNTLGKHRELIKGGTCNGYIRGHPGYSGGNRRTGCWHRGLVPNGGAEIVAHEFDVSQLSPDNPRILVYDENDVKIYAFPVIHSTKRCGSGESCTLALPPF